MQINKKITRPPRTKQLKKRPTAPAIIDINPPGGLPGGLPGSWDTWLNNTPDSLTLEGGNLPPEDPHYHKDDDDSWWEGWLEFWSELMDQLLELMDELEELYDAIKAEGYKG